MIVDCHTHMSFPASELDIAEHLQACEESNRCLVLPYGKGNIRDQNQGVSEYARKYKKMIGFGIFNPLQEDVNHKVVQETVVDFGLKGIVLYCATEAFHPTHSRAMQLYEIAMELRLPVFFCNGAGFNRNAVLDYAQPYHLDEIARIFQDLKIIIGSMGLPFLPQTICMLSKHENVYGDLTISPRALWEVYTIIVSAHESGVMDKLLFGSGYPFATASQCIETLLRFNRLFSEHVVRQVPREKIRHIIERDTITLLGLENEH